MTTLRPNPAGSQAAPGRGGRPRLPQSMEPRQPLDAAWLDSVRRAQGERDTVRVEHAGARRDYRLFFITGHPRSGTHWLGSLLNLHPAIYSDGEFFFDALREGHDRLAAWKWLAIGGDEGHRALSNECFQDSVRRLLVAVAARKPGATHIGDRTPRRLTPFLPGAAHIVALRDGRDVLVSWTFHQLRVGGRQLESFCAAGDGASGMQAARRAFAADPAVFERQPELLLADERWVRSVAAQWAEHVRHDEAAIAAIAAGRLDAHALVVRYEDVHADPDSQLARMIAFLGLDPGLAAPVAAASGTAAGHERSDPRSFFRKGEVGEWRRYFTPTTTRWFNEEAGHDLASQGYAAGGAA